mmetsp:Transcript_30646/g.67098  ORF Transcript_30646/g.67098 Transcript_30646/m.67098 type:complete len:266 (-) Transcript_30646:1652-2449(-)
MRCLHHPWAAAACSAAIAGPREGGGVPRASIARPGDGHIDVVLWAVGACVHVADALDERARGEPDGARGREEADVDARPGGALSIGVDCSGRVEHHAQMQMEPVKSAVGRRAKAEHASLAAEQLAVEAVPLHGLRRRQEGRRREAARVVHTLLVRLGVPRLGVLEEPFEERRLELQRRREHRPRLARQHDAALAREAGTRAQLADGLDGALGRGDVAEDLVHDEVDVAGQVDVRGEAVVQLDAHRVPALAQRRACLDLRSEERHS